MTRTQTSAPSSLPRSRVGDRTGPAKPNSSADVLPQGMPGTAGSTTTGPVLTFIAYGTPGPQGSKTGNVVNGRVVMRESSKKVRPWRQDVRDAALHALPDGWTPLDCPLEVDMVFTLRKPLSAPKTRVTYPSRYPDVSKLCRSTEDALTGIVWTDDARIVNYRKLGKRYPLERDDALTYPGVIIRVYPLTESGA